MKNFFIRLELAGSPSAESHDAVRSLMAKNGFLNTLEGYDPAGESKSFQLPSTLYYGAQTSDAADIRNSLFQQLEELSLTPTVLVIESGHWAFRD